MSLSQEVLAELNRHGRTAIYRRMDQGTGAPGANSRQNPPDTTTPVTVAMTANAGASAMTVSASQFRGRVKAGDTFMVQNDLTLYTISADATAVGNQCALTFSPSLSMTATAGENVALFFQADTTVKVAPRRLTPRDLTQDIQNGQRMLVMAAKSLSAPTKDGDRIYLDGAWLTIVGPPSIAYDGEEAAVYRLIVRG